METAAISSDGTRAFLKSRPRGDSAGPLRHLIVDVTTRELREITIPETIDAYRLIPVLPDIPDRVEPGDRPAAVACATGARWLRLATNPAPSVLYPRLRPSAPGAHSVPGRPRPPVVRRLKQTNLTSQII